MTMPMNTQPAYLLKSKSSHEKSLIHTSKANGIAILTDICYNKTDMICRAGSLENVDVIEKVLSAE